MHTSICSIRKNKSRRKKMTHTQIPSWMNAQYTLTHPEKMASLAKPSIFIWINIYTFPMWIYSFLFILMNDFGIQTSFRFFKHRIERRKWVSVWVTERQKEWKWWNKRDVLTAYQLNTLQMSVGLCVYPFSIYR